MGKAAGPPDDELAAHIAIALADSAGMAYLIRNTSLFKKSTCYDLVITCNYVYTKPCICRFPGQGFSSSTKQRQKAAIPEAPSHTVMRELQCNLSVHPVRAAVRIQPHGAERRRKQKPNPKPEVHNLSVQRAGGVCKGLAGLGGNGEVDQCALKPRRNN